MTTKQQIADLRVEIRALEQQTADEYWPQWQKNRDLDGLRSELARLISGR